MKSLLYVLSFLLLFSCSKDEDEDGIIPESNSTPSFITFFGGIGHNDNSTITSNDNNLLICGNRFNNVLLLKTDKNGNQINSTDIYTGLDSRGYSICENSNNDVFMVGQTRRNFSVKDWDVLLVKFNPNGDTLWTKDYGGTDEDYGRCIMTTSDGNILIGGHTYGYGAGSFPDIYLVKVNYNGDTLWTNSFPHPDQEITFSITETNDGNYLVTGTNQDNSNPREMYLLKVGNSGIKMWDNINGPATWKWGLSTIQLSSGDLITSGYHTINGFSQVMLVKTDNNGNKIWEKLYGQPNLSEIGVSIILDTDGGFVITGSSYDVSVGEIKIILLKTDANGNQVYWKTFGSSGGAYGANILKDVNGDNIITGMNDGSIFITKTDINGEFK